MQEDLRETNNKFAKFSVRAQSADAGENRRSSACVRQRKHPEKQTHEKRSLRSCSRNYFFSRCSARNSLAAFSAVMRQISAVVIPFSRAMTAAVSVSMVLSQRLPRYGTGAI